jgi:tetratricopeptide (TPR) repeat protein
MGFRILSFLSLFLIVSCASKNKELTPEEKRASLYYNQGTRELVAKDYTLALQKLLKANKYKPNDSKICNNLGMAYYFKKDVKNAVKFLKKAIKLNSENTDAKLNLATIHMKENNYDKAKGIYNKLLEDLTYLGHHRTYYNLALISLVEQREQEAIEYLNKSVEINENYCPAFYKLGEIAEKRRQYKKALEFYKDATIGTCYNNIKPHMAQVDMMAKLKNYDDARIKLDEMLEKFAMTKEEIIVKNKIESINAERRNFDNVEKEYSKNIDRNFLSTDF